MATISNPFKHLVLAVSIVVVLTAVACATVLLLPESTLAQAGEPRRAEPDLLPTAVPPPAPPPLQLNPPSATPEPGAVKPSSGPQVGRSDLEVVQFRPDTVLRLAARCGRWSAGGLSGSRCRCVVESAGLDRVGVRGF
jgi:hypothetical protein